MSLWSGVALTMHHRQ